jgi:5'(3')-deoxyribonucleotidase
MGKLRIALDVDGVLADFVGASLHWVRSQTGFGIWPEQITSWEIENFIPKKHRDSLISLWNSKSFCASIPIIGSPQSALLQLREKYIVRCVTSPMKTNRFWKAERELWLKNLLDFKGKDIIFSSKKYEHADMFDMLIDDGAHNVTDWLDKTSKPSILIDRPWNSQTPWAARAISLDAAQLFVDNFARDLT